MGYWKPKLTEHKNSNGALSSVAGIRSKGVDTISKSIYRNVNLKEPLGYELTYQDVTVQQVSHYATRTLPASRPPSQIDR